MGRPSKSQRQRRERAAAQLRAQQDFGSVPHSFVFLRGRGGRSLRLLVADMRRVLEPFTARALRVRKSNSLKDFVAVAGPLGVTHFLVFSKSESSINLKLFRLPGGPTLTFKVVEYSLLRDVVSALRRHRMHEQQFRHPPLLVLSSFGLPQSHIRLMASTFQNLLPSINVHRVNLNTIKRCLLISYDAETELLHLRHYIKVVPVGVSRGLKKLLQEKFPNLSRLEDISELLVKDLNLSESEAEQDGPHNVTELPQAYAGRGNAKAQQSAVRLTEIGPRLTLQLNKVEEGLAQGNVLYHSFIHKPEPELRALLARREAKLQLRAERRQRQEENVERKRQQRQQQRERSLQGMRRKQQRDEDGDSGAEDPGAPEQDAAHEEEESDAEHYRREVGEEPDQDLFPSRTKRKRLPLGPARLRKRRRRIPLEHPMEHPMEHPTEHPTASNPHPPHRTRRKRKLLPKGKTRFQRPGCARKGKR
ncbi:suppressor of SWI4 1 homolog isoform X2 [Melopsittacus undulatus]|uniref:suppressor of SWI4 1 homolog isoform X2 n=1 Tax=Melopsittacus undulatus TaxID=13146 RepID=UPI001469E81D|nr:suppressor of SWI4 1 homolog isoform X2 [Melopsittacus undulatus]